jgi:polysaccharide biosynthesis protein PslG
VTFRVNGRPVGRDRRAPYTCRWSSRRAKPGRYRLRATATDAAGNRASATIRVTVRRPAPQPAAAPASSWSGDLQVGLVADSQGMGDEAGSRQDKALPAGVKWLREEFKWGKIEPSNDQWDFHDYDVVMAEAAKRGLNVMPLLHGTPDWAGGDQSIPEDPSEFAEFTAQVVKRYGPAGSFWAAHPELPKLPAQWYEVWNEPYYKFSAGNRVDPARYARLFKAAAQAGKAADPATRWLVASEFEIQTYTGKWVEWPRAMVEAVPDLGQWADAIAVHPYAKHQAPGTPFGDYANDKFLRLNLIRDLFRRAGVDKPYWITEIGWSTCTSGSPCVDSEARQAANLTEMFSLLRGPMRDWVQAVFVYHLNDTGDEDSEPEHRFGLLRADGSPKPAWAALQAAAKRA